MVDNTIDDNCDEVEIKIEYNDSFETDPLSHEFHSSDNLVGHHVKIPPYSEKTIQFTNWYKSIDDVGNFICSFCERRYASVTTLRFHVNRKHPEHATTVKKCLNKRKRNSQHRCHLCKCRFLCTADLKKHVEDTHGYENIAKSCLFCDGSFNTLEELTEHLLNSHNKVYKKIHICKVCGYRTFKLNAFEKHKYIHTELKMHKCQSCDYSTNHLYNMKSHEKRHDKIKYQTVYETG